MKTVAYSRPYSCVFVHLIYFVMPFGFKFHNFFLVEGDEMKSHPILSTLYSLFLQFESDCFGTTHLPPFLTKPCYPN